MRKYEGKVYDRYMWNKNKKKKKKGSFQLKLYNNFDVSLTTISSCFSFSSSFSISSSNFESGEGTLLSDSSVAGFDPLSDSRVDFDFDKDRSFKEK